MTPLHFRCRPSAPIGATAGVLELWLAVAAGRLLLRDQDSRGLRRLAELLYPRRQALDVQELARAVATAEKALMERLNGADAPTPLGRIRAGCDLSDFDLGLMALAVLPCLDEDAARSVAAVHGGARRLSMGLALRLLVGEAAEPLLVRQALRTTPLWRRGLLRPGQDGAGDLEQRLDPSEALLAGLDGVVPVRIGEGWQGHDAVGSDRPSAKRSQQAEELARAEHLGVVHLCGPPGAAEQVLVAGAGPRRCVVFEAPVGDHPKAPWAEAELVRLATGARVALAATRQTWLEGPPQGLRAAPVIADSTFSLRGGGQTLTRLELGGSDPLELAQAWREALPLDPAEADLLASRTWLDPALPAQVAAQLPAGAGLPQVLERLRSFAPQRAAGLAVRREPEVRWNQLVLAPRTMERLEDLVRRVEQRVTVQQRWQLGLSERGRGVVGLLHGESGTGKTLAAEAIAHRLQLPMLSVDLSLVVSKFIGETEKNLSELFAAAEGFAALLFFDEADALFGKRTSVQDAHDRYANIEVNFLLQRLEAFEGLALLSTNLLQGMDEAFLRRFDQLVPFSRPGIAERLAIWTLHLPKGSERLAAEVEVKALARRFDLTGGEIRNAALSAAYAAAGRGVPVGMGQLEAAVREQYLKTGRPFPVQPP